MINISKFVRAAAFLLVFLLLNPLNVSASLEGWDFDVFTEIQRVDAENQQLRDMLNNLETPAVPAPTPLPVQAPMLRLVQPQTVVISPGESIDIDIVVRNIGRQPALNSLATVTTTGPLNVEFLDNTNVIGTLSENTNTTVRMRVSADVNAFTNFESRLFAINLGFAFRNREGSNITSSDVISIRIDDEALAPRLTLRDFFINRADVTPGDSFTVSASLANLGEASAYNVQVSIAEGLDPEGIFLSGSPNTPFIQVMEAGGAEMVSFVFAVSDRAASGTAMLLFEITGRTQGGEEISEQIRYFVPIVSPLVGVNRAVISASLSSAGGTIGVGVQAAVDVALTNSGTLPARNIRVTAVTEDGIVAMSANRQNESVINPGETVVMNFVFAPTDDAGSHFHTVGFEIEYETGAVGDMETDSFEQFIGLNVFNPDGDDDRPERQNRPRILVSAYSVEPMIVWAGQEFDLSLTFFNASSTHAVYNIKVTLRAVEYEERSGAVFTTIGASNTIFMDRMAPRAESSHELRMFTVPNAAPRTYNIEVVFEYEAEGFEEQLEETEQLSINVRQMSRLELSNIQIPGFGTVFQPVFADFNIINSGRVPLTNLRISMEGDFDTQGMDIFVGNMGRGNTAAYTGQFTPMEPGEHQGTLIVSGEDEIGELTEYRHEFTIFVDEAMMFDDMGGDMMFESDWEMQAGMPSDEGLFGGFIGSLWMWGAAALLAIIVVAVIALVIIKKKRNNRDLFEEV